MPDKSFGAPVGAFSSQAGPVKYITITDFPLVVTEVDVAGMLEGIARSRRPLGDIRTVGPERAPMYEVPWVRLVRAAMDRRVVLPSSVPVEHERRARSL